MYYRKSNNKKYICQRQSNIDTSQPTIRIYGSGIYHELAIVMCRYLYVPAVGDLR